MKIVKIWYDLYGRRSPEFIDGVIAGLKMFAHWRNGIEYVGTCGVTLNEAIKDAIEQMSDERKKGD